MKTRASALLGSRMPIVQSGMRWASRAELVAAVANAGAFGILSAHTQPDAPTMSTEWPAPTRPRSKKYIAVVTPKGRETASAKVKSSGM